MVYNKALCSYKYVSYSWPNGLTECTEICWGNPWVLGEIHILQNSRIIFLQKAMFCSLKFNSFLHGQRWHFSYYIIDKKAPETYLTRTLKSSLNFVIWNLWFIGSPQTYPSLWTIGSLFTPLNLVSRFSYWSLASSNCSRRRTLLNPLLTEDHLE